MLERLRFQLRPCPSFLLLLNKHAISLQRRNLTHFSSRQYPALEVKLNKTSIDTLSSSRAPIVLSDEQHRVLEMVLAGKNVFFTGPAGTGKSVLLRQIIRTLCENNEDHGVAITASTGIAAASIGGGTLHSFAGVGLAKAPLESLIKRANVIESARRRLRDTKVLIIDEVSMVDARWFDILNAILKAVRRNRRPFGGIQLVICGDFFQLPPVPDHPQVGESEEVKFAFEAESWNECVPATSTVRLTKVFRQVQLNFVNLLNELREGVVSPQSEQVLRQLSREVRYPDGIQPTELFPHRYSAEAANRKQLAQLKGKRISYSALDKFGNDTDGRPVSQAWAKPMLDKMAPKEIELAVGAQVMCTKNITDYVVNGSVGVVTKFTRPSESTYEQLASTILEGRKESPKYKKVKSETLWPQVRFDSGKTIIMDALPFKILNEKGNRAATRHQVPLILAWALTIHRAQGQTLQRVKVDLSRAFASGQAYVALSRCTSLQGLQVLNFSRRVVFCDPRVIEWSKSLLAA